MQQKVRAAQRLCCVARLSIPGIRRAAAATASGPSASSNCSASAPSSNMSPVSSTPAGNAHMARSTSLNPSASQLKLAAISRYPCSKVNYLPSAPMLLSITGPYESQQQNQEHLRQSAAAANRCYAQLRCTWPRYRASIDQHGGCRKKLERAECWPLWLCSPLACLGGNCGTGLLRHRQSSPEGIKLAVHVLDLVCDRTLA